MEPHSLFSRPSKLSRLMKKLLRFSLPPSLLLVLDEPLEPELGLELATSGEDGQWRRQHDRDGVGVVRVGRYLSVVR